MEHQASIDGALSVALALAAGMIAQTLARHVRLPGIVLLLATGVLLGPELLDVIRPASLGESLHVIVGFSVAVILFEGGLSLSLARLRQQALAIRRLITTGAVVTALGGTFAARFILGWDWYLSIPFGTLVVVTGPTVVTPLLRRIKVKHKVATILEAEGVLIDAIGAVLAVVALQVVISPIGGVEVASGVVSVLGRLAWGLLCGLVGGLVIALPLRYRKVIPEGLENVFTLSLVLVLFQASNLVLEESGIMAVTAAGLVVGNMRTRVKRELAEFKEQLTVMLIGMLFVILAADVELADIQKLGWPGLWTLLVLMFVVRPLNVLVSTHGTGLSAREKAFLSWLAPRGVVAAAVASLFSQSLKDHDLAGGDALRALVFLVISGTVLLQGLTGGLVAGWLGVRRPAHQGWAVLGANAMGRAIARVAREAGEEVVMLDNNPTACREAEADGFRVIYGNVLEERTLRRAQLEDRAICVGVTANEEVNLILARQAHREFEVDHVYVAIRRDQSTVSPSIVHHAEAGVLFGRPRDLELWIVRFRRGHAVTEEWELPDGPFTDEMLDFPVNRILPLVVRRSGRSFPFDDRHRPQKGDLFTLALHSEALDEAHDWLRDQGWKVLEREG